MLFNIELFGGGQSFPEFFVMIQKPSIGRWASSSVAENDNPRVRYLHSAAIEEGWVGEKSRSYFFMPSQHCFNAWLGDEVVEQMFWKQPRHVIYFLLWVTTVLVLCHFYGRAGDLWRWFPYLRQDIEQCCFARVGVPDQLNMLIRSLNVLL